MRNLNGSGLIFALIRSVRLLFITSLFISLRAAIELDGKANFGVLIGSGLDIFQSSGVKYFRWDQVKKKQEEEEIICDKDFLSNCKAKICKV
jgi:hypothetical protein